MKRIINWIKCHIFRRHSYCVDDYMQADHADVWCSHCKWKAKAVQMKYKDEPAYFDTKLDKGTVVLFCILKGKQILNVNYKRKDAIALGHKLLKQANRLGYLSHDSAKGQVKCTS